MKTVRRTAPHQPAPDDATLLDLRSPGATVHIGGDLLDGLRPPPAAQELLRVAQAPYLAHRIHLRDGWQPRDIELLVPVTDPDRLRAAARAVEVMLRFLINDEWAIAPADTVLGALPAEPPIVAIDAVCLLSGGLDSLTGAIDLLTAGRRPQFVSHYEPQGITHARQTRIFGRPRERFGSAGAMRHRRRALAPHAGGKSTETTTPQPVTAVRRRRMHRRRRVRPAGDGRDARERVRRPQRAADRKMEAR